VIAVAGVFFGKEAVEGQIVGQIQGLVGEKGAAAIETMVANAARPGSGAIATVIGAATLLYGSTRLFAELQESLDAIWNVEPKPGESVWRMIKRRFVSFTMVIATGFLLLVSLVVSAAVAGLSGFVEQRVPGFSVVSRLLTHVVGLLMTTGIFAAIFKVVPDVDLRWRDVWVGALVTAVLFSLGRFALGEYLGRGAFASAYGAAGSLVVVLFWVYYSAQILFLGAEFTQVHARSRGSECPPKRDAVKAERVAPSLHAPAEQH
jgi:membrane protein